MEKRKPLSTQICRPITAKASYYIDTFNNVTKYTAAATHINTYIILYSHTAFVDFYLAMHVAVLLS